MLVYISGAITNNKNYYEDFEKAEDWLVKNNHEAINVAKIMRQVPQLKYEQYMKIDYALIDVSDAVFMLDGWQKSKGACAELSYAKALKKKVLYQDYFKEFRNAKSRNDNLCNDD